MKDSSKTRQALIEELTELRLQSAELKKSTTGSISAELAVEEAQHYAENIVETIREPLLVLDAGLKIISANRNFYRTFRVNPAETLGNFIYDLGNKQWDIPRLRELLEEVLPEKQAFNDFEVDHNFQDIGHKTMLLNARQIHWKDIGAKIILLAIEDITERKKLESLLMDSEEQYRRLFETASDGIVLLEKREGKITHANPAIEKILGFTNKESIGNSLQGIGVSLNMGDFQTTMQDLNKRGIIFFNDVPVITKSGQHIDTDIYLVDRAKLVQCNIRDITEHKQAEDELRDSEKYFKAIIENSSDIILILDKLGSVTYASPSVERFLGYGPDELIGKRSLDLIVSDDKPRAIADFGSALLTKELPIPNVFRIRHKDGTERILEGFGNNLLDNPAVAGFVMNVRDITARKQTEDNIKQLTNAMDVAIDGMALLNKDGEYIYLNQAHARIYGYENAGELIGKSWRTLYDADEIKRFDAEIMPNFGQKRYWQGRAQGMKKDGSKFAQEISLTALESGGLICIVRDITDHKRAEEQIYQANAFLNSIVENIPNMIFLKDAGNLRFVRFNRAGEDLLGYSRNDLLGKNDYDFFPKEQADHFTKKDREVLQGKEVVDIPEEPLQTRNKGERTMHTRKVPLLDMKGEPEYLLGISEDITEQKRAEEQRQHTLDRLRKAINTTIQVMVSAVEVRDPYTAGHQIRSADLSRAIATEMGLPKDTIEGIRMAGSIHDIGKLSIPAEILSKPTKLSDIEFSLIKEHALKGYEMLKDVESPWPLAQMVYQHHERMDGSGYPRNLKGEEILIEARILTVADVVESMASHRPYRPSLGIEAALDEIVTNKGILYDEAVTDACLRLFREKGFQLTGT